MTSLTYAPFTEQFFGYCLVVARLGGAFALLPGLGEMFLNTRVRVALVLCLGLLLTPVVFQPSSPLNVPFMPLLFVRELMIGILFGALVKLVLVGIEVGGTLISFQIGLSSALLNTPITSGAMLSTFLVTISLLLLFIMDIHHMFISCLVLTYDVFPLCELESSKLLCWPSFLVDRSLGMMHKSLRLALEISGPLLVIGFILNIGFSLFNRLVPSVQIFHILGPLQILIGFAVFTVSIPLTLQLCMEHFHQMLNFLSWSH